MMILKNVFSVQYLMVFVLLLSVYSCEQKIADEPGEVETIITTDNQVSIKLSQILNIGTLDIKDTSFVLLKRELFGIKSPKKMSLCFLLADKDYAIFYIDPEKNRHVEVIKNSDGKISFSFDKEDVVNNFTVAFHEQLDPLFKSDLRADLLITFLDNTEATILKQLKGIKNKVTPTAYKTLKSMVTGKIAHLKFIKSESFENLAVDSSYYDFVETIEFDDTYLTYSDNLNTVHSVLDIKYERLNKESFNAIDIKNKLEFINQTIPNSEVKSAIISFLSGKIIPEKSAEEKQEIIQHAIDIGVKKEYLDYLRGVEPGVASGAKVGSEAKYLETLVAYDKDFKVKQLEGKTIYVDNWATWCGPCMKTMDVLEEKQSVFEDLDDFVYVLVSFDRSEEIWRNYVKSTSVKNSKIVYLYNGTDMKSAYSKYYNISGLPSYLVIGKQGLVVDVSPKEPHDSDFVSYLKSL